MTTKREIKLEVDVVWDPAENSWVATAPDSSGKNTSSRANSPTRAMNRLQSVLAENYGREVELTPKLIVPRELLPEYKEYQRRYKRFSEDKEFINEARKSLGFRMVDQYRMPIATVASLFGLSSQRFGMMKQEWEMGITRGSAGRPRKNSDDDE